MRPANEHYSNPVDLQPDLVKPVSGAVLYWMWLVPIEAAPDVLAVNSDFDEGRIDATTGYASPDCDDMEGVDPKTGSGNTSIALEAHRDHLDGKFIKTERITKDMHKGWFGVNPDQFDEEFWDGATITIRKVEKIDTETGHPESGQVRMYAKWGNGNSQYRGIEPYYLQDTALPAKNLVVEGLNGDPGKSVYGTTSGVPSDSKYYIEGVRPGKITLEWRLQKDNIDVTYEQEFLVATEQSVEDWREEVRYQIRLQSFVGSGHEVDIAQYKTSNGFRNTHYTMKIESVTCL
jgi:hypothetical protein